ncbi:hypothetical protein GCM10009827_106840 [Dactylosporangium maewongense]|uniref:Uncharacterized protein n=1 Tax=Dactylosporangium maewongense TaxID=634393 RepID=A0ABP4NTZ6_9ACTN
MVGLKSYGARRTRFNGTVFAVHPQMSAEDMATSPFRGPQGMEVRTDGWIRHRAPRRVRTSGPLQGRSPRRNQPVL